MTATSHDMTAPRPHAQGAVYAVYGDPDPAAATLEQLQAGGIALHRVPTHLLAALETGSPALRSEALAALARRDRRPMIGAVGFDDWWNTALAALNPDWPLAAARALVTDKARLYTELRRHGVPIAQFHAGPLSIGFLAESVARFGPRPVLKPTTGAGSRGVYRYRADLTIEDNLALYRQFLALGHIDPATSIIAAQYLGGDDALEVSVDVVVGAGSPLVATTHEKATATSAHPFVDNIMISPPTNPAIVAELAQLPEIVDATATTVGLHDGVLHIELRLHQRRWHVLDVGVRPGAGLVAHSATARTGTDPRAAHLAAGLARPLPNNVLTTPKTDAPATCIACCYIGQSHRANLILHRYHPLAAELRADPSIIGWHLNLAETDDQVYLSDAGLSLGITASTPEAAMQRLRTIVEPYAFTTSSTEVVAAQ